MRCCSGQNWLKIEINKMRQNKLLTWHWPFNCENLQFLTSKQNPQNQRALLMGCFRQLQVAIQKHKKLAKMAKRFVSRAGAYCYTMATSPNTARLSPNVCWFLGGFVWLVRRRAWTTSGQTSYVPVKASRILLGTKKDKKSKKKKSALFRLFERSEFLIDTSQKKICLCVRLILVLVWKKNVLVLVWGTYYVPHTYVPGTSERFVANCGVGPSTRGRATPLLWWSPPRTSDVNTKQ